MKNTTRKLKMWKMNTIRLVNRHKLDCHRVECNISLFLLVEMAEKAGVEFTKEEREVCI